MDHQQTTSAVAAHYADDQFAARVQQALIAAGKGTGALTPADLAPLDQFHTRGRAATEELAVLAGIEAGMRVLELGGGIGGAARTLASAYDCDVTVLDLTDAYVKVGEMLTARTELADRVHFQTGDALQSPFDDGSFDVVWTQHAAMNIADKARLYSEAQRVLRSGRIMRSGGRLALHDIMAGDVQPIHFPVPWARVPETSFLLPPDEVRRLILEAGFREVAWLDKTAEAVAWFEARLPSAAPSNPLGLHLLLGDVFNETFAALVRNLQEGRVTVFMGVFERV